MAANIYSMQMYTKTGICCNEEDRNVSLFYTIFYEEVINAILNC